MCIVSCRETSFCHQWTTDRTFLVEECRKACSTLRIYFCVYFFYFLFGLCVRFKAINCFKEIWECLGYLTRMGSRCDFSTGETL